MIEYITYKGEKLPVRIAYSTFKRVVSMDLNSFEAQEEILWGGLRSGHIAENKELKLKREDMEFVLDESIEEFKAIVAKFQPPVTEDTSDKKNSN